MFLNFEDPLNGQKLSFGFRQCFLVRFGCGAWRSWICIALGQRMSCRTLWWSYFDAWRCSTRHEMVCHRIVIVATEFDHCHIGPSIWDNLRFINGYIRILSAYRDGFAYPCALWSSCCLSTSLHNVGSSRPTRHSVQHVCQCMCPQTCCGRCCDGNLAAYMWLYKFIYSKQ